MIKLSLSRTRSPMNVRQQFFAYGGGILLMFGFLSFVLPGFLAMMDMEFSYYERIMLLVTGATLLALEQNTDEKIQQHVMYLVGAVGIVLGSVGMLVHFGVTTSTMSVVNMNDTFGSFFYLCMGIWAVMAGMLSEKKRR